jgi:copper chaperone CopZ
MHTTLRVDGANCPLCLDELTDRLRGVDGINSVTSSISAGCLAIDHDDLATTDLVDLVAASLHGVTMAANEIVMTNVDPVVAVLHCTHEPAHGPRPPTEHSDDELETVTGALTRLRADGYTADFFATNDGQLCCRSCDRTMHPADVQVDHTIRFEGDTNPDDEDIVFAIRFACGCKGIYSAAYGPTTPTHDTAVLRGLAHATNPETTRHQVRDHIIEHFPQ